MKRTILAALLTLGLGLSVAMADTIRPVYTCFDFPATKDAGITTLGQHTNRGADSQISFCNGTDTSGEFGIFDFDRAAIRDRINANLGGLTLQEAVDQGRIEVHFSLVPSGNVAPDCQVGVMSVYTDDNWAEGAGASSLGSTAAYNWPGASTDTAACTAASPADAMGTDPNWHRTDTNASGQQLASIPGTCVYSPFPMTEWVQSVRNYFLLDDAFWCGYIFGQDLQNNPVPASSMLRTYGFGSSSSPMTCYTKEAGANYAPMLTVVKIDYQMTGPLLHAGDANNDGRVDVVDLGVLAKNYDRTGLPTSVTNPFIDGSWKLGDFNNDGNVNVVDLGVLAKNYDWSGAPDIPTPEPGSAMFLLLTGLALSRRLGRK